jgi:hypothetical protein
MRDRHKQNYDVSKNPALPPWQRRKVSIEKAIQILAQWQVGLPEP